MIIIGIFSIVFIIVMIVSVIHDCIDFNERKDKSTIRTVFWVFKQVLYKFLYAFIIFDIYILIMVVAQAASYDFLYEENKQIKSEEEIVSFTTDDIVNGSKSYYAILVPNNNIILKTIDGDINNYKYGNVEEGNYNSPKVVKYTKKPNLLWNVWEYEETIIYVPENSILDLTKD